MLDWNGQNTFGCEYKEIKFGEHVFGYEFYVKFFGKWNCELRLFVDDKNNNNRLLSPLKNDIPCNLDN